MTLQTSRHVASSVGSRGQTESTSVNSSSAHLAQGDLEHDIPDPIPSPQRPSNPETPTCLHFHSTSLDMQRGDLTLKSQSSFISLQGFIRAVD